MTKVTGLLLLAMNMVEIYPEHGIPWLPLSCIRVNGGFGKFPTVRWRDASVFLLDCRNNRKTFIAFESPISDTIFSAVTAGLFCSIVSSYIRITVSHASAHPFLYNIFFLLGLRNLLFVTPYFLLVFSISGKGKYNI